MSPSLPGDQTGEEEQEEDDHDLMEARPVQNIEKSVCLMLTDVLTDLRAGAK